MRTVANAIAILAGLGFGLGCKPKPAVRGSVSAVVAGRQITASVEGSGAFVHTNQNGATVRFRGHKVEVEKERVVVDGTETANISSNVTIVEILVRKDGTVAVNADGVKVLTTKLRR